MRSRDWWSARFAALAVAVAVLVAGAAFRWTQAIVVVAVGAALVPLLPSRRVFERRSPLVVLCGVAVVLTAIQLVPLPHAIVDWLSPIEVGLRDDGASLVGISPWSTITQDVPGTLRALVFFVALLGIAIVAVRMATSESGRYWIVAFVAGLCGVAACVTWIHRALGLASLYGFITPTQSPHLLCTIINYNSFACVMAVGTVLAMGLAMHRRQATWLRVVWVAVVGLCALTTLATLSRGGALALCAGGFVTVVGLVAQRLWSGTETDLPRRRGTFMTSSMPIAVVAICAVVVVLYAGTDGIAEQFHNTHLSEVNAPRSKFAAWRSSATLIDDSPWVGVGRGAFEPTFTRVHPASAFATYAGLENEYLQAVVDWGVPGALVLAFVLIWLVVVALRRWRDGPLAAGALGAFAVVALQSNVDFGVEFFGIAAPITAVVATLAYVPLREATVRELSVARGFRIAHLVALAGGALLLLSPATTTLEEDHAALEAKDITLDEVRTVLRRHPLDYLGYATAARAMMKHGDRGAIQVLNHALILHPTHPGLHLMAARLLYAEHPDQATIEYAAAIAPLRDNRKLLEEIVKRFPPELAAKALPIDTAGLDSYTRSLEELGHPEIAIAWLDRVLELQPQTMHACDVMYGLAIRKPKLAAAIIDDKKCAGFDPSPEVRMAVSRALLAEKRYAQLARLLDGVESWTGQVDAKVEAWLALCDALTGLERWDDAKRCIRHLDAAGLVPPERETELSGRLQRIEQARADHP